MDMISTSAVAPQFSEGLPVRRFAMRVVSEVARANDARQQLVDPILLRLVVRYALDGDTGLLNEIHALMAKRRFHPTEMMDVYLPQAVQQIGTAWHNDDIDILHASMAFSRIQDVLRELARAWVSDRIGRDSDGRILVVLPSCEQHTLGAMFVTNQLRRKGVSVKVALAASSDKVASLIDEHCFNGVFMSISNPTSVAPCGLLIRQLRRDVAGELPVVLGGSLVSAAKGDKDAARIAKATGADIVTNDVGQALKHCGIRQMAVASG